MSLNIRCGIAVPCSEDFKGVQNFVKRGVPDVLTICNQINRFEDERDNTLQMNTAWIMVNQLQTQPATAGYDHAALFTISAQDSRCR